MEKNRILDACLKASGVMFLTAALMSCGLPRIVILNDPLTPEEHVNLGVAYEKKGELDAALEQYKTASTKLPMAYLYLGNIYFQKNDFDNAEKAYKQSIAKTESPGAYNNLAWLYYTTDKNLEEAEKLARKAVDLSPGMADFRDTLEKIIEKRTHK